jgi:hypothetical protein
MDCVNSDLEYIELPVKYCLYSQVVGELCSTMRNALENYTASRTLIIILLFEGTPSRIHV